MRNVASLWLWCVYFFLPDQRLDLCKLNPSDSDTVRGQIVGKAGHRHLIPLPPSRCHFSLTLFIFCPLLLCHAVITDLYHLLVSSEFADTRPHRQRRPCGGLQRTSGKWWVSVLLGFSEALEKHLDLSVLVIVWICFKGYCVVLCSDARW